MIEPYTVDRYTMSENRDEGVRLLWRYRTLCEATGIARASGAPLAPAALEELKRVEQRLASLLEDAPREVNVEPRAVSSVPARATRAKEGEPAEPSKRAVLAGLAPAPTPAKPAAGDAGVIVFTDGSAEGNPGPGGYCAIVRIPGRPDRELSGGTNYTTNNKMELTAAIAGLTEAITSGAPNVSVVTDSEYVVKGATQWLRGWERNGWKTANGQPVKNRELWEKLAELLRGHSVRWQWVKGHAGHPENERADLVATSRAREAATR